MYKVTDAESKAIFGPAGCALRAWPAVNKGGQEVLWNYCMDYHSTTIMSLSQRKFVIWDLIWGICSRQVIQSTVI